MPRFSPFARPGASALMVLFLGLAACGQQPTPAASNAEQRGQVIAKVGGEDVTIHELQNEYRRAGVPQDKVTDAITRAALDEVTRRKVLAQKAKTAGLDREPTVLLDLLRSREQVLAAAILQRDVQSRVSGLGRAEIDRFINAKSEGFAGRRRFDVEQLTLNSAAIQQDFLDAIKDASALDSIEAKAQAAKIAYTRGAGALFTGDIPAELATRLRNRKDTDVFFIRSGPTSSFFKVRSEAADPLAGEEAQNRARGLMRNEAAQAEVTKKVDEVPVTYFGDYVKLMEKTAAPAAPPADEATPAVTQSKP